MKENKLYLFYCQICGFKKITDASGEKDFQEHPSPSIPGSIPYLDPFTNETVKPKERKQYKKFKCPSCGRIIVPKKIENKDGKESY